MLKLIFAVVLLVILLLSIILRRTFSELSPLELKRRSRAGDSVAKKIYKAAVYDRELTFSLWVIGGLSAAGVVILLTQSLSSWLSFIVIAAILWVCFFWFPLTRLSNSVILAELMSSPFAWVLQKLHPVLGKIVDNLGQHQPSNTSQIYQTDDLMKLIERQEHQRDNRIPKERLEMAIRALNFGDFCVKDIMVPRRMVVSANSRDTIGPILMEELHKSGHNTFPVYEDKPDNIVGTLFLKDIINLKSGGTVSSNTKKAVFYVHEEQSLEQVFHAFLKTRHHMFIVVNKFEEMVGIITVGDVIGYIIGKPLVDEFDQYDNPRAVAEQMAKQEHAQKVTEMIE